MTMGFVSLVGAGPGNPDLLTLGAARALGEADVVFYDDLVQPGVLAYAERARCLRTGKRKGRVSIPQEVIQQQMIDAARAGLRVVRLKGGDPFVFGRGGEEALALAAAGIPFEVVPGLSSAVAAPGLAGIPVKDTPDLMRRLAVVGITTREACGNSVRNVTACPLAGVCGSEAFDVAPYARACAFFLLGHPDAQEFGRKFKISFSGCADQACGLATFHDLGFIARTRGRERGFELYVGGGLGAVPHQARLFDPFLPERELLPVAQAVCRVFARLGEKKNRARARLKFLVARLGVEEFRRLVQEERRRLRHDERWTAFLERARRDSDTDQGLERIALEQPTASATPGSDSAFEAWRKTNVFPQKQSGYNVAAITLPLGDFSSSQARAIAEIARQNARGALRTTVDQNVLLRWIPDDGLNDVYSALTAIGLGQAGAGTIVDVTACPGTDTCKLGIASSRGLAAELRSGLLARNLAADAAIKDLHIKVSGCFNSCGQHHVADLGFYGVSRRIAGRTVPHFQVVLGGEWTRNAKSFGLAIGAVPSKRIPEVVDRLTERYRRDRQSGETFPGFVQRVGKGTLRALLEDLMAVPAYDADRTLYSDWGDPREFTTGDMGQGECAGEVVSGADFALAASERQVFEAQVELDRGATGEAARLAYRAMLQAAGALVRTETEEFRDDDALVHEFRVRLYDTRLFFDPFAGGKFARYLLDCHDDKDLLAAADVSAALARQRIEEAQLFIKASYTCQARLAQRPSTLSTTIPRSGQA